MVLGILIAPALGNLDQVFQYIQEYTGFISTGVVAVFIFGIFWRRTTANAALAAILLSVPINLGLKLAFDWLPFLDRTAATFLILCLIMVAISVRETQNIQSDSRNENTLKYALIGFVSLIALASGIKMGIEGGDVPFWFSSAIIGLSFGLIFILWRDKGVAYKKQIEVSDELFKTENIFNISAFAVTLVLVFLYVVFW